MSRFARLEERIARLQAVVDASVLVNSTLDLRRLAEHVVDIATRLIDAERGSLFLVDTATATLSSLVAQGIGKAPLRLKVGDGIVGAVAASGQAEILNNPYDDPRFDPGVDRATGFHTRSLLTVPVSDRDGRLVAVLQLLNHRGRGFTGDDVEFLEELAVPFAIALTTARLHRDIVARERMTEELRLAAEIQRTLRPRNLGGIPGLELEALVRPCREVGGDYYDVIPAGTAGRWWLVMADISGKGVSAGLIASNVQAYMWSRRGDRRSLPRVVEEGNDLLYQLTQGRKYATLAVLEWHPADRRLSWVNAGHPPVLLCHSGVVEELGATGRPIGLLPDQTYQMSSRVLEPGDLLMLYTDGVHEAGMGSTTGEFGFERLAKCFAAASSASGVVGRLAEDLAVHLDQHAPDDDVTVLCARVLAG